ncbi:uncharacterized protein V6R79_011094 [Siganus canaliculatus]
METDQPASETPACPETAKDQADKEEGYWEAEGYSDYYLKLGADSAFIRTVKSAVYHRLNKVISDYRIAKCHGCSINHPSQRRHECLEVLNPYFYESNFSTPGFIPAIQRLLITRDIRAEDARYVTAEASTVQATPTTSQSRREPPPVRLSIVVKGKVQSDSFQWTVVRQQRKVKEFVTMEFKANKIAGERMSSIDGKHITSVPTTPRIVKKKQSLWFNARMAVPF